MKSELDQEWIDLILTAKEAGLTIDDVRVFLNSKHPQKCTFFIPFIPEEEPQKLFAEHQSD